MRAWLSAVALAATCAGCPKPPPPEVVIDWADTPRLPSPSAGTYARAPAVPPDPAIAELAKGLRWDASLAGAAAGVALALLEEPTIPDWRVRHLAWRAGYPHPLRAMSVWQVPTGAPPPPDVPAWLARVTPDDDIGLVRARDEDGDTWVALIATPRADLGVVPRQLPIGGQFRLPVIPGARFSVASPAGDLRTGALEIAQAFTTDLTGEWLIKVEDDEGVVARFPIYVAQTPPMTSIVDEPVEGPWVDRADALIDHFRQLHDRGPLGSDPLFDAAAKHRQGDPSAPAELLSGRLGWASERFMIWDVTAASITEAVDRLLWEPSARPALLAREGVMALTASDDPRGVRLVVLVGYE